MHVAPASMPSPLREDTDGILRIGQTRVTLQSVISAYDQGAGPEEIVLRYPVLALEQAYAAIGFFLANERALRAYLDEQQAHREAARLEAEQRPAIARIRSRLRERR